MQAIEKTAKYNELEFYVFTLEFIFIGLELSFSFQLRFSLIDIDEIRYILMRIYKISSDLSEYNVFKIQNIFFYL